MEMVLVFRPELLDSTSRNRFEGIEVLGIVADEDDANRLIDETVNKSDHPGWEYLSMSIDAHLSVFFRSLVEINNEIQTWVREPGENIPFGLRKDLENLDFQIKNFPSYH